MYVIPKTKSLHQNKQFSGMFVLPLNTYLGLEMPLYQHSIFKNDPIKSFDFCIRKASGRHLVTLPPVAYGRGCFLLQTKKHYDCNASCLNLINSSPCCMITCNNCLKSLRHVLSDELLLPASLYTSSHVMNLSV